MIVKSIIGAACTCLSVVSFNANAALVERLGGLAYYDPDADLTWLADANAAGTSGLGQYGNGNMSWTDANAWAAGLEVAGVTGWRLPDTLQPDASCYSQNGVSSFGFDCSGSEMGNMFYNVLGNTAATGVVGGGLTNTGPFSNFPPRDYYNWYWSATEYVLTPEDNAWYFDMGTGAQWPNSKGGLLYAWAVHSGDVSAVPIPSAVWLFGSGLIGLIGLARRKTRI